MVFIIDDDHIMAECISLQCRHFGVKTRIFHNAIDAISALNNSTPSLIFLDILLDGPNGFTFLNETISYSDTVKIPVVIVSSLDISHDLSIYGVVGVLNKATMLPHDIKYYVQKYLPQEAYVK